MTTPLVPVPVSDAQQWRRVAGALLLIAAPALTIGARAITNRDRSVGERLPAPITAIDSQAYNSLIMHGAIAQARHDGRWTPTGYATLGLAGTLAGIALLAWAAKAAVKR
jgi:hypothetical protein